MTKNIMIVGVGGQGTLLTSRIIGKAALSEGLDVKISEVHGMAQRGGSVVTFVRFGDKVSEPVVEEGDADVIIAFERLEALRYAHFLKKDGVLVVNDLSALRPTPKILLKIWKKTTLFIALMRRKLLSSLETARCLTRLF